MPGDKEYPPNPEDWDTNNFFMRLPDDFFPEVPGEPQVRPGFGRREIYDIGLMDTPQRMRVGEVHQHLYSQKYLDQTAREFFATVDRVVDGLGMRDQIAQLFEIGHSPQETEIESRVSRISDKYFNMSREQRKRLQVVAANMSTQWEEDLRKACLPIFEKMLEMDYSKYDLSH